MVARQPDVLSLGELRLQARAFDEISNETGAHYTACSFVDWLSRELNGRALDDRRPEHIAAGMRRSWRARRATGG